MDPMTSSVPSSPSLRLQPYTMFQEICLMLLRLVVGGVFIYAGIAKFAFWGSAPAGFTGGMLILMKFLSIVEPLGGAALILGFLTRWAGYGLAIIMVGAIVIMHFTMHTALFTGPQGIGLDYNFLLLAGSLALAAFSAGKWSADAKMHKV